MAAVITAISGVAAATATTTAVTGLVVGGVTIGTTSAAVIGALVGTVVSAIVGSALIDKPTSGNFASTSGSVLSNTRSNNAPIPLIYGTRRVGGAIVFMDVLEGGHFFVNFVVSEGEIESYEEVYFNNELASNTHGPVLITEFKGSETQEANTELVNAFTYYTNSHKLSATAYLTLALLYTPFPAGMPLINVVVKGIKTFDPRTTITEWNDNPVLCIRDYLTNARYGRGINTSLIDDTSFILAANYCDEVVAYNGVDSIKRYTCNGLAETQNSSLNIINKLLSSCRGLLIFSGGLYKVIIDKPEMPVFTFSEDNIIGGWKIKLGGKNSQYNRMRANYFDAGKDYQPDIAYVDSNELRVQDGGLLEKMIDLPFTTDIDRAKAIITINLNQSRYSITCEFTSTIEALRVEVGDVVYINHKTPGWDTHNSNLGKKFRIMRVTLQNNDEVRIIANEYADEVYDVDLFAVADIPTKIDLDDLSVCLPPTDLRYKQYPRVTQTGGDGTFGSVQTTRTINVEMSWTASLDNFVVGYEVGYKYADDENWSEFPTTENLKFSFEFKFTGVPTYFNVRVRAVNSVGVVSEWLE